MATSAAIRWVVPAALAVASVLPFRDVLHLWPCSRDAALWILRGVPSSPHWAEWIFATRHFRVGYRPLTALSYTVDHWLGGLAAWPYRLTDLGLHAACVALVSVAFRRLVPHAPPWGAWLAGVLFGVHPLVEQVVPELARRSYSMSTALVLAGIVLLCVPVARLSSARLVWAGTLLGAAILANEIGVAVLPAALLLVYHATGRGFVRRGLVLLAPVALVLAVRAAVVAGVGGYESLEVDRWSRVVPILAANWRALFLSVPIGALATAYYLWRIGSERSAARVPAAWLITCCAIYAPLGVWFPRQAYPLLAPLALLMAWGICEAAARTGWRRAAMLAPQLLLVGAILVQSTWAVGPSESLERSRHRTDAMLRDLQARVSEVPHPARVTLAVPHFPRPPVEAIRARERRLPLASRLAELWVETLFAGSVSADTLLVYHIELDRPSVQSEVRSRRGEVAVRIDAEPIHVIAQGARSRQDDEGRWIDWVPSSPGFLYVHDGAAGRLTRLEPGP